MGKLILKAGTHLAPLPAALLSCGAFEGQKNLITLAWVGIVNSEPPMLSVSIRPQRYSHQLIKESGQFVVNVPGDDLAAAVDLCGNVSGRDTDKFALTGLTARRASQVDAPIVAECPVNLECRVRQTLTLGSHDLFIAEIVAVQVSEEFVDHGRIDAGKLKPLVYAGGEYFSVGAHLGKYGFGKAHGQR
jgi:flavin reductase (DIM6/NTAB) family NADH-FMN oxidoreductase RutF